MNLCDYDSIALRPCAFCGKPTLSPWEIGGRVYCGDVCAGDDHFALSAPAFVDRPKRDGGLFSFEFGGSNA